MLKIGVKPGDSRNETGQQPERNRAATGMKPSSRNEVGRHPEMIRRCSEHLGYYVVAAQSHVVMLKNSFMNGSSFERNGCENEVGWHPDLDSKAVSSSQRDFAVTTWSLRGHYAVTTVTTRSLRGHYGHYAVTTVTTRSLRHYAVTTRPLRSLCGHKAVTTRSLRGHYAVTTRSLRGHYGHYAVTPSLRGHYAATTVTMRSQSGHYAVTTRSLRGHYAVTTRSLRGHYAVTTVTTRSPRGHYAVKKSYTFEAEKTLNFAPKRPIRSRHCCVDLEGSDFINASNLIHYTANRFQV